MDVDSILHAIYDWPISEAIRTDYFWFPFFESIHVIAITLVVGSIFIVDLRLLGITSHKKPVTELAKAGFDPVYGARPLKRAIQSELENPLAKAILEGRFAPRDTIRVDYRGSKMTFEKAPVKAAA